MTPAAKEVQKSLKQLNERINVLGKTFGEDSLVYQKAVEDAKSELGPQFKKFYSTNSHGFFKIDATAGTSETIVKMGAEGTSNLEDAINAVPTQRSYTSSLKFKQEQDFDWDEEYSANNNTTAEKKNNTYSNVMMAVKKILEDVAYGYSPEEEDEDSEEWQEIVRTRKAGLKPTYWQLFKYISKREGLDWQSEGIDKVAKQLYSGEYIPRSQDKYITAGEKVANANRQQAKTKGTNPYGENSTKPNKPKR